MTGDLQLYFRRTSAATLREQFFEGKGFDKIIVGAKVQSTNPVSQLIFGGQHEDMSLFSLLRSCSRIVQPSLFGSMMSRTIASYSPVSA